MWFGALKVSGGGGNAKSGTVDDTTSASQSVQIPTGLSSISRFVLTAQMTGYDTYQFEVVYDVDINSATYNATSAYSGGAYGGIANIGSAVGEYSWKLDSISGGTVNLHSPSRSGWGVNEKIKWFAE